MAAKKMKWSPLPAVTLAGLTLAALATACDADAPTGIDDALLDVLANPEAAAEADGSANPFREQCKSGARSERGPSR